MSVNLDYSGYGENAVTMRYSGSLSVGCPLSLTAADTVSNSAGPLFGTAIYIDKNSGCCSVQTAGAIKVDLDTSSIKSPGYYKLSISSDGKVKADENGRPCFVLNLGAGGEMSDILM
jgi:hypothetical protein